METGRLIPAAAYLRMSSDQQDTSISQQKRQLMEFAQGRFEIAPESIYKDEGKSGSKNTEKRTDFLRMLSDAPKAKWQVILCLDISRFGRLDSIEGAFAKKTLRDAGKKLHTVIEGEIDWNSTTGRIVDTVLSEAQHDYSVRLSQKTLIGKLDAFKRGELFGFKCPYGLARMIVDTRGTESIVPRVEMFTKPKGWKATLIAGDPEEVEVVRWLYETFNTRDVGFRWLAAELNRQQKPSPTGGRWCSKVVAEILDNEKYVGDLRLGERAVGAFWRLEGDRVVKSKERQKSGALSLKGTHDGIISRTIWERVQEKLKRRKAAHNHSHKEGGYALKGVLWCGNCGKPLYGNPNKKSDKKTGKVKYVCKTAIKYGRQCSCAQWGVLEEEVLPFVIQQLIKGLDRRVIQEANMTPKGKPERPSGLENLERKLAVIEKRIALGSERFLSAPAELVPELATTLGKWKEERGRLLREIEKVRQDFPPTWDEVLRRRRQWFENFKNRLVRVETARHERYSTAVNFTADGFREFLVANGCRVDIWWSKKSACRWRIAKVRIRLLDKMDELVAAPFDTSDSLIVWCGARNGRRNIND